MDTPAHKITLNPSVVYDYNELMLYGAKCPTCTHLLNWKLNNKTTDNFMVAYCCGLQFGMVPEAVRVISVPLKAVSDLDESFTDGMDCSDEDFMKALEAL